MCDALGLAAARFGSGAGHYCDFVEDDGGVFDENAVGKLGVGGQRRYVHAQFGEAAFVGTVLLDGLGYVDRLAVEKCELAGRETRTYLSS